MSKFYKILKADKLGDPWQNPNYPDSPALQRYWCQVEGEDWPVSISKQVPNTVTPGEHVYGDLLKEKSQRGTDYWKFKSAKVPDGVQRPADTPAQATAQAATGVDMSAQQPDWFQPWGNLLTQIAKDVKALVGVDEGLSADAPIEPPKSQTDSGKPEQISGPPLSEEEQTKLDDIFTVPPETPEGV